MVALCCDQSGGNTQHAGHLVPFHGGQSAADYRGHSPVMFSPLKTRYRSNEDFGTFLFSRESLRNERATSSDYLHRRRAVSVLSARPCGPRPRPCGGQWRDMRKSRFADCHWFTNFDPLFFIEGMSGIYIDDVDYSYYDYPNYARSNLNNTLNYNVPSWPSLIRVLLVMLLRIGCVLIHIGSVPVNNVNLILLQNVIDFCWVTFTYLLIGSVLAYTGDSRGVVGEGHWVGDNSVDKDEVMIGWSAVVIAAAICTCGVVGRMHTVGYLIIGFLLASLIQPLIIHWVWTSKGWIRTNVLSERGVEFYDYSGSTVVHIVGGLTGLIGCMTLGRRILRLDAIDDASIAVGSSGTVFAGQLLVFIGLQCLSMPNVHLGRDEMRNKRQCNAYINNLLAGSSCSVIVILIHFVSTTEEFNHWTVMRCVQAIVAGLVMISAGTDIYYPSQTIILGAIASIVFYLTSRQVFHSAIEDYCNIIATHLVCAILGSILVPFFNVSSNTVDQVLLNVGWQLICLFIIIIFVGITMYVAFALLQFSGLLRNRSEYLNHLRANIAEARTGREKTFLERLFQMDEDPIYLQPGTASAEQRRSSEIRA